MWDSLFAAAETTDLESSLGSWGVRTVAVASILIVGLLLYSARQKRMKNKKKKALFGSITGVIVLTTVFLFATTIYINSISDSRGPVHWHTDIEFWACGTEVELRDPKGALSNKIGSPTYHEHNDKRIHLEGVVVKKEYDASLEKFMDVTGGEISTERLIIPTNQVFEENEPDGDAVSGPLDAKQYHKELNSGWVIDVSNGQTCGDEPAEVQAFVYTYNKDNDTYSQTKLADPARYIMRDESVVPPGDCVIVEFAPPMEKTDKLCLQFGIRDNARCEAYSGGVHNDKLCTIYEVDTTSGGTN